MDKYDKVEKLKKLLDEGAISAAEFEQEKEKVLAGHDTLTSNMDDTDYCMFMHLSQFLGFVFPFLGLIVPVTMWLISKDKSQTIDAHGRVIVNWVISSFIYFIICFILFFIVIGIPMLVALVIADIIFVILGAIKARNGEVWQYPMSIPFFKPLDYKTIEE